ncbi:metalloregulator ArsR/SmtB family transcription factor [Nocardioides panacisoli]|uniref:helix-turn-helix domain-containing GNAT family N-acetyltransferase n=1 Tax=Nocardioides panacisoli TaxID=627624 RepID=UPI001C62F628|nr:metalloregulator ArsR/SmtB family transcription factor [Nocardioides panacisoli]QYJ02812.1 metalloregulator ArsR/SmtB family transcription factor [Nocardioides panacisoli]
MDVIDTAAPPDTAPTAAALEPDTAATYAEWFATLADPTRVRLLHAVAASPTGGMRVGDLATALDISQATCSHHVRRLADVGFVVVDKVGTASVVSVNAACCTGLPHAADVVMGTLAARPCCPEDLPTDVTTRAMTDADLPRVREIYAAAIGARQATFETEAPTRAALREKWLPGHRWVAELDGEVVGFTGIAPTSPRACYAGVGETTVHVAEHARGRGVGTALLHRQVTEADAGGLWTLQAHVFPENRASLALHRSAGYETLAVRSRIARLDGEWRDTVLLERRRADDA